MTIVGGVYLLSVLGCNQKFLMASYFLNQSVREGFICDPDRYSIFFPLSLSEKWALPKFEERAIDLRGEFLTALRRCFKSEDHYIKEMGLTLQEIQT